MAATQRTPDMIDPIVAAKSDGNGDAVGWSDCWRWMLWLIASVIVPLIQNGSESA